MLFVAIGYFAQDKFTTGEFWIIAIIWSVGFGIMCGLDDIKKQLIKNGKNKED